MMSKPASKPAVRRLRGLAQHTSKGGVAGYQRTAPGDYIDSGHALSGDACVAVTGAAGYVGGWIVKYCLERGYSVRACVRNVDDGRKTAFLKAMPEYGAGLLTLHAADMTKEGAYDGIFEGVHTVFHPAEVFMSAGHGAKAEDLGGAEGERINLGLLHSSAMRTSEYIVDSINKSSTTKRLIYTASIASMMPSRGECRNNQCLSLWVPCPVASIHTSLRRVGMEGYADNPIVDEGREPHARTAGAQSYGITKRATEHFFSYEAARSGGKWSVITGNPGDIIGPIQSKHQASETWQGKIASVLSGEPTVQEGGRPWMLVDARDVAMAEILLAESCNVESGERFLLSSVSMTSALALHHAG
jgi:nucleoside-diphosphate-sugar epimerase